MIPKRIDRKPETRDDYANLGNYIAAAKEKGEKLDKFWIVKCDAGTTLTDLDTALIEIETTRRPSIADKTYHLVVSFHPGEEDKLSLKAYQAKPMTGHPGQDRLWRAYTQARKPGFLKRALHIRNWKDYLLAEAHKDALALAIVLTYKELFHLLDEATTLRRRPYQPPRSMAPALNTWFAASAWKPPATTWLKRDLADMDVKADDQGRVLFPFRDDQGHIWALGAVDGQGRSTAIGDMAKPNLSHVIDPGGDLARQGAGYGGPVIITADCLSAALLHKDSGHPVIVVPEEKHLGAAARSIRAKHPNSRLIIATPVPSRSAHQAAVLSGAEVLVVDNVQAQTKIVADLVGQGEPVASKDKDKDGLGR